MSDRPIIRCYECPNYSGGKYRGKCRELKTKVEAVDYCYRDEVKTLKKIDATASKKAEGDK